MAKRIVVFSTKGGVGKTIVASNLAVSLSREMMKRVLLADFDLQAPGDMAKIMDLAPPKAAVDLINYLKKDLQAQSLKKPEFLLKTPHNLDFLSGVTKPQQAIHFDPTMIRDVFRLFDKDYDFIIADIGKNFSEASVATLNQANLILLIVTPDVLSVYQTKWALDTLQFLQIPSSMTKIVLNRAESISSIHLEEIRSMLAVDIIAQIPSEGKIVGFAMNRRVPVVVDSPRSRFSLAISKLAQQLIQEPKLFVEHRDVDMAKLSAGGLEKAGAFWQKEGLVEPLADISILEEKDEILLLKRRIHNRLIEELNLKKLDLKVFSDPQKKRELKDKAEMLIANLLTEEAGTFISSPEVRKKMVKEILDEALGLGPLEDLIADPSITDIMVNNKDEIYVERNGKLVLTSKKFISNEQVRIIIERIIAPLGRRLDESVPMVDARLPDGSRVNAIIPPLALGGPTLTIRKFAREHYTIEDLMVRFDSLNKPMSDFLKACVVTRRNMIVSGGTGSGKTTFLNILSEFVPDNERIITIEDAAELRLSQEHWIRLESRPPNIEGRGEIAIRDLFRNTLRMRPDRIIVGECRGREILDMLQAMNTGHDGSMSTIHANSTQDVLIRLDSMILMSGTELPIRAIREMVSSAVNLIVHTARLSDGTRKVIQITEFAGMLNETQIDLKDVFVFNQTGVDAQGTAIGAFTSTGYIPTFYNEIRAKGIFLPKEIFQK